MPDAIQSRSPDRKEIRRQGVGRTRSRTKEYGTRHLDGTNLSESGRIGRSGGVCRVAEYHQQLAALAERSEKIMYASSGRDLWRLLS